MENILNKITTIEEKLNKSLDLLDIAKGYCDHNFDKGKEIVAIGTMLDVILADQKEIANSLDGIV